MMARISPWLLVSMVALVAGARSVAAAGAYACSSSGQPCCPPGGSCAKLAPCSGGFSRASALWGCGGEAWDAGRLGLDWSFAGYRHGEAGIPTKPQSVVVTAFGAKGDGVTDDSGAIVKAIAAAKDGSAVFFPPGKYAIKQRIDIRKPIVLRGAGKGATTLFFPLALADVAGNRGGWGHGTCFINFWGWNAVRHSGWQATRLATVTGGAAKGSTRLSVDSTANIRPGAWVRLVLSDSSDVFKHTLMGGVMEAGWPGSGSAKDIVRFSSRVKSVAGGAVELERPLPWDVKPNWGPSLHEIRPSVEDAGVESMTFEFKWTPYPGHLKEDGLNALHFNQLANSWVRDVRFLNADSAVYFWGVSFSTVQDVEIDVTKSRATSTRDDWSFLNKNGHRAVWSEFGESNLFQRITVKAPFVHDFTVATAETGSVWTSSSGADLNLDFHKGAPSLNLYTDLDMGAGSRPFRSGGGAGVGPNAGNGNVFWNLKASQALALPGSQGVGGGAQAFGPGVVFVGVQTRESAAARADMRWVQEDGSAAAIYPANLWSAMRARRGV